MRTATYLAFSVLLISPALWAAPGCSCEDADSATPLASTDAANADASSDRIDAAGGSGGSVIPMEAGPEAEAASPLQPFRCIGGWPSAPGSAPVAPLDVTPTELWRKRIPSDMYVADTVLAGDRLGIVAGGRLLLLDLEGNLAGKYEHGQWFWSPPVADNEGNFYVANDWVTSIRSDGSTRWAHPLGPSPDPEISTKTSRLLLSPDGILYFAATDGNLYAVRADDGTIVYAKHVGTAEPNYPFNLIAGVGDTIIAAGRVFDRTTGESFALPDSEISGLQLTWPTYEGLAGTTTELPPDAGRGLANSFFLDRCGKLQWALPNDPGSWTARLTGFGDTLLVHHSEDWVQTAYLYSSSGERLTGPKPVKGVATAIGADGTCYFTHTKEGTPYEQSLAISALSQDFEELWSMDFGPPTTGASATLADDGVLYLTRELSDQVGSYIEVIAVQTASPGLARTAIPTFRNNNRRTGWLE